MERKRPYEPKSENLSGISSMSPGELGKRINQLEKQMYTYARDLEFELAAQARDELTFLNANSSDRESRPLELLAPNPAIGFQSKRATAVIATALNRVGCQPKRTAYNPIGNSI